MSPKIFLLRNTFPHHVAIQASRERRPCRWLAVAYHARHRHDLRRLVWLLVESIVQNRDHSGKQSQILYRSPTMQAVRPVLQSGSRSPRSSPATLSAAPCGARGSNKRRASRGSRGLAPLQSGNFQDLTRVDSRILVTLDCKILVTAWAIRALHGAPTRAALTARWCRGELGDGAGVSGPVVQG